ncbi:MAG: accessory factor UbiK family protein [Rhodospirillales bacterium]|nr:accessory factor UbiK family protein [Rhodospirillales bacterium]
MRARPAFLDDLAGMAGGALSMVAGLREEIQAVVRGAVDEALRRLDLVRREEMEVLEERVAALEAAVAALERPAPQSIGADTPTPDA